MWDFFSSLIDLWFDKPKRARGWLYAIGMAALVVAAALLLDRCGRAA